MIMEMAITIACVLVLCRVSYAIGCSVGYTNGVRVNTQFRDLANQCNDIALLLSKDSPGSPLSPPIKIIRK